jgi:TetR/AcrR family transcriptional repressor of bet genes
MPRKVDHDERRRHIVEALLRLAGTRGLDAVTLREVAQEAGVSMGAVQHYFTSKREMLAYALDHWLRLSVHEGFARRVVARLGAGTQRSAPADVLMAVAAEYLPHDGPSRYDARVALAFTSQAAVEPALAEALGPAYRGLAEALRDVLAGTGAAAAAPEQGRLLAALLDGLRTPVLLGALDYDEALRLVEHHLEHLIGGPLRRAAP